jgi:hypothetical protein
MFVDYDTIKIVPKVRNFAVCDVSKPMVVGILKVEDVCGKSKESKNYKNKITDYGG